MTDNVPDQSPDQSSEPASLPEKLNQRFLAQAVPGGNGQAMPELRFDAHGIGGCEFSRRNAGRMGHTVQMRAATFLKLVPPIEPPPGPSYIDRMCEAISAGAALANPYLLLKPDQVMIDDDGQVQYAGQWHVVGHEGRHRCKAILALASRFEQVAPLVPVTLYCSHKGEVLPLDAHDLRTINTGLLPQHEEFNMVRGPLFSVPAGGTGPDAGWAPRC